MMLRLLTCTAILLYTATISYSVDRFPEKPKGDLLLFDYADVLSQQDEQKIKLIQSKIFTLHDTPIVIITIRSMANLSSAPGNIKSFAQRWFHFWGLGSQANNKTILFLLSMNDQKACIELGESWNSDWNHYCQEVMEHDMIPNFKRGKFSLGIIYGVEQLANTIEKNSEKPVPVKSWYEKIRSNKFNEKTPVPLEQSFWIFLTGIAILLLGLFLFRSNTIINCGLVFVIVAIAVWLILYIFFIFLCLVTLKQGFRSRREKFEEMRSVLMGY